VTRSLRLVVVLWLGLVVVASGVGVFGSGAPVPTGAPPIRHPVVGLGPVYLASSSTPDAQSFISTTAGAGSLSGYSWGNLATDYSLSNPGPGYAFGGMVTDANGNLVFTDGDSIDVVPRVSGTFYNQAMVADHVYQLAGFEHPPQSGSGTTLADGVVATQADLTPTYEFQGADGGGLAVDPWGNVVFSFDQGVDVIAESPSNPGYNIRPGGCAGGSNCIWTTGEVFTIAGAGGGVNCNLNGIGGPAYAETLCGAALAIDPDGDVLIGNQPDLLVVTVASTNPGYPLEALCGGTCTWHQGDIFAIAGTGYHGSYTDVYSGDGAVASSAGIDDINGLAVDGQGNVLFTDDWDSAGGYESAVRVIAVGSNPGYVLGGTCGSSCGPWTDRNIYTIAGGGTNTGLSPPVGYTSGSDGGPALSAQLDYPTGLAVDASGNVLVADTDNNRIRLIAAPTGSTYAYGANRSHGDIYTVAGDGTAGSSGNHGPATSAELDAPLWVAELDPATTPGTPTGVSAGQLFVDDYSDSIRAATDGPVSDPDVTPLGVAPTGQQGCKCADPVVDSSGDDHETATDLSVPGEGIPMTFARTYDAIDAQEGSSPGDLGPGWSDTLDPSLHFNSTVTSVTEANGTSYTIGGVASIMPASGEPITFDKFAIGATEPFWCPSDSSAVVYCPGAPRWAGTLSLAGSTWTYVDETATPVTYTFSGATSATLDEIEDAEGDTLIEGTYSPGTGQVACPSGDTCTAWQSQPAGASGPFDALVEAFSGSELVGVFGANTGDPQASFSQSTTACSVSGTLSSAELCSATDLNSLQTTYQYEGTGGSCAGGFVCSDDLTKLTPPDSAVVTNTFDVAGRVTKQVLTTGGVSQETDLAYSTGTSGWVTCMTAAPPDCGTLGATTTTITTYPNGNTGMGAATDVTTASFYDLVENQAQDPALTTTYDYVDPTTLEKTMTVDGDANVAAVGFDSSDAGGTEASSGDALVTSDGTNATTQRQFVTSGTNAGNEVWCQVDAAETANGVICPTSEPAFGSSLVGVATGMTLSWFDSNGHLIEQVDPLGDATVDAYTSGVSDVPNGLLWCSMDAANLAAYLAAHSGATYPFACSNTDYGTYVVGATTKTFDAAGSVLTVTDPDGDVTTNCYFSESGTGQCAHGAPSGNDELEALYQTTDPDKTTTTDTYNSADQVTKQVVNYGTYQATTINAYDSAGRLYCTIAPLAYAEGYTSCVSTPPTSPPTAGSDASPGPWPGQTITIYDDESRVLDTVNPVGGVTQYAYDGEGNRYCTVKPAAYASGTTCPSTSSLPLTVTTPTSDPYTGASIDYFDADNRIVQETNPLGGITLTGYDPAGNVAQTTVESNDGTHDPNIVTTYTFDADNRVASTTIDQGGGSLQEETEDFYDPNGNLYCSVSAVAVSGGSFQCPTWQPGWILTHAQSNSTSNPNTSGTVPSPIGEYSTSPTATQANDVTLTFHDEDGNVIQTTNPDVETTITAYDQDNRPYCSADATNVAAYLVAHSGALYPYGCPLITGLPSTWPPAPGSDPGYTATVYDAAGRTLSVTDPLGDTQSSTYEPDGGVLTETNGDGDTTTNCYAFENASGQCAEATQPGSWDASHTLSSSSGNAEQVSCPTASFCAAVDSNGRAYTLTVTSSGASWTTWTGVSTHALDAVSCASASFCVAGDANGSVYIYSGTSWSGANPLDPGEVIESLSCLLPKFCAAVDMNGKASVTTNGTSWSSLATLSSGKASLSVSCVSASFCAATSNSGYGYIYNGTGWTASSSALDASAVFMTASCASTTLCVLGDNNGKVFTYNGSWSSATTLDSGKKIQSVSCAHLTTTCVAVDSAGKAFVDSSNTWGMGTTLHSSMAIASVSCSLANRCVEIDNADQAAAYDGSGWSARVTLNSSGSPMGDSISCPTAAMCVAVSSVGSSAGDNASIYHGSLWQPATAVDGSRTLKALSCVSVTFCMGVDSSGYGTDYSGGSHTSSDADGSTALASISCPTITFCMAGDTSGNALGWTPSGWSSTHLVDGTDGPLTAMSCSSSTFCVAGDAKGKVWEYTGSWSSTSATLVSSMPVASLSCVSSSFCAAGTTAKVALYTGGSWSTGWSLSSSLDSGKTFYVSCASSSSCLAVDSAGKTDVYNGSWGTLSGAIDTNGFTSVSCPAALYCQATDTVGQVETDNNGTWSGAASVNDDASLAQISCPTESFCGAVDGSSANLFVETGSATAGAEWSTTLPQTAADPAGRTTTTTELPDGQPDVTTTSGGTSTDTYDVMGDVVATNYGSTASGYSLPTNVATTYNQNGTRATMADVTGTTTYGYDALGDLTCTKLSAASGYTSDTEIYGYFTTGVPHTVGYPDAGAACNATDPDTATYAYDADGQMTSVSDWSSNTVSLSHDEDNNTTAQDNPGSADTTFSYDEDDQMTQTLSNVDSSTCSPAALTITQNFAAGLSPTPGGRNADNQLTQYYQQIVGSCPTVTYQRDYAYDLAARLIYQGTTSSSSCTNESTTGPGCLADDAAGNPIEVSAHDSSGDLDTWAQTFDADGEALTETPITYSGGPCGGGTSSCGATYTSSYDTNGDLAQVTTSSTTSSYGYDQNGKMTTAITSAGTTSYTVTGDGLEASVTPPGASLSQFTWDEATGMALVLSDGSFDYLYGPGQTPVEQVPVSSGSPTFLTYFEPAATMMVTTTGGVTDNFTGYDAGGNVSNGTSGSAFGYDGQYEDTNSGFVNLRARFYDTQSGEFTTVDPMVASTNQPYEYSNDDPVNGSDPLGLSSDPDPDSGSGRVAPISGPPQVSGCGTGVYYRVWIDAQYRDPVHITVNKVKDTIVWDGVNGELTTVPHDTTAYYYADSYTGWQINSKVTEWAIIGNDGFTEQSWVWFHNRPFCGFTATDTHIHTVLNVYAGGRYNWNVSASKSGICAGLLHLQPEIGTS